MAHQSEAALHTAKPLSPHAVPRADSTTEQSTSWASQMQAQNCSPEIRGMSHLKIGCTMHS